MVSNYKGWKPLVKSSIVFLLNFLLVHSSVKNAQNINIQLTSHHELHVVNHPSSTQQLHGGPGERRASSVRPQERCRGSGGAAAPSTGSEAEGQEAKLKQSQEKRPSGEAPQTVCEDQSTQTNTQEQKIH